jgi:peptidyl-prolyl cis-trans isomerase A (cyclophilin A)/peptidyl-prolyl cis-trans isomerase B (cyclophilin B)
MLKTIFAIAALLASFSAGAATAPQVELRTNMGTIVLELAPDNAPVTVENFLQYVKDGQYSGTIFHRVIPGFMIQGGGFTPDMQEKKTRGPIKNEAGNGLRNAAGTIAMARLPDPHSASAQFFINLAENPALDFRAPTPRDYGYTVFGRVVSGMEVVKKIGAVRTGPKPPYDDVPQKPVIIESARIVGAAGPSGK